MPRKVVQIIANCTHFHALCDEGKRFRLTGTSWSEVTAIPQRAEVMAAFGNFVESQFS
jgi:hypothetical protein